MTTYWDEMSTIVGLLELAIRKGKEEEALLICDFFRWFCDELHEFDHNSTKLTGQEHHGHFLDNLFSSVPFIENKRNEIICEHEFYKTDESNHKCFRCDIIVCNKSKLDLLTGFQKRLKEGEP